MSVTLKPTDGLFLRDYKNGSDLHIGITNSKGEIFEFDSRGVSTGACWKQFLNIQIPVSTKKEEWDLILEKTSEKFKHERYDDSLMNCFSFVTSSLASIEEIAEFCKDKAVFSEKFLTESTKRAAKYISVYRHIEKYGFYII
ncbi:hypothetical protein QYM36_017427 [Artemia franciscana]|uniref:MKRN2 opposite strand protein-like C-terminal domain-containing protein n=2 Tax=Artemia franciscana TaxID=6661 RepID=A0AA88HHP8_ARTSF|nr:hypothetical protein QYM36_017427 [Artemia franciscana]